MTTQGVAVDTQRQKRGTRSTKSIRGLVTGLKGLVPLAVLLLGWELLGGGDPLRFPKPSLWPEAVTELSDAGVLLSALERSLTTFVVALMVATAVGIALGLVVGSMPRVGHALGPLFDFFRGLPVPVIIPVGILLLGVGLTSSITIVVLAIVWPVLLNTVLARQSVPRVRLDAARVLDLSGLATLRKVILPSVFPAVMVGVRISASLGVITTLVVEMISGGTGLGFLLLERQSRFDAPGMWGVLALVGAFGFLMNALLAAVETRFLRRWSADAR